MDRLLSKVSLFSIQVTLLVSCAEDFVVVEKAQMSRLYVVSTVPSDGSTGVKRDLSPVGAVVINFSKAIDERYADPTFINFTCNEAMVNYKVSLSEDKQVLSLKLKSGSILPERAECRVVISHLIRDTAGLPFYLSPSELGVSTYTLDMDGGVDDVVVKDSESGTKSGYNDRRSGEGDYVFNFQTEYLPLEITGVSPADEEVVAVDAIPSFEGVVIGFNKSLDPDSVNISNFLLIGEAIEPVLSEDAKTVTLRPTSGLKEGKDYTVMIMPFVTDTSGISLEKTLIYRFRTDFVAPEVTSISIADGSMEVDYKTDSIRIDFNKDMAPSTISSSTIRLIGVDRYSVRYEGRSAFIENFVLFERQGYSVEIDSTIMDMSGFYLKSAYSFHFRTSYDAPFVRSIFPQDKASGLPVDLKSIDIEFSEDMNFENINREFFSISGQKDFEIKVKDSRNLSLLLVEDLLAGNTYTVKVSPLLMDISGINMERDFISTFKVSETPDNNPPSDIVIYSKPIMDPSDKSRQGFVIEWKAPGGNVLTNDILSGKVRGYQLVYSESPFESSDFDKMRSLLGVPTPLAPGEVQNIVLYSLVDVENNEVPIVYNRPYYFMLSATDGTNVVYSNLLRAGILADTGRVRWGSKFGGYSLERIEDFNGEDLILIGDTDEIKDNLVTGALFIERMENGIMTDVMRLYGRTDGSLFGYAVEVLDLNSDECPDIAVSAPLDGEDREGAVYLYFQTRDQNGCRFDNDEPVRLSAGVRDSFFGLSLARIRLSGKDNLLVGAPRDGALGYGAVYIYENRPDKSQIPPAGDIKISRSQPATSFGYAVLAADFNGDGCDDTIISAPDAVPESTGDVYVFYSTTGVEGCTFPSFNGETPSSVMRGESAFARFGSRLFVSDLDGDNKDEIFISARDETEKKGIVYVRRGRDGGFIKIYGKQDGDFGYSFAEADDYLRDGCKGEAGSCRDVFVSDRLLGRVYLLEGRTDSLDYDLDTLPQFGGEYNAPSFGHSLLVDKSGVFENLLIAAPCMSHFGDFVSNLFLYR